VDPDREDINSAILRQLDGYCAQARQQALTADMRALLLEFGWAQRPRRVLVEQGNLCRFILLQENKLSADLIVMGKRQSISKTCSSEA
jgi:hypothetical protein